MIDDETGPSWRLVNVEEVLKLKYGSHPARRDIINIWIPSLVVSNSF